MNTPPRSSARAAIRESITRSRRVTTPSGSGRRRPAAARDDAADWPPELRRARRRAAAARRRRCASGPRTSAPPWPATGGTTGSSACRAPRSFEGEESSRQTQLGASRRRRSDHAGLEDHVRGGARSRDRGVRPRRGGAGQGGAPRAGVSLADRQVARRALVGRVRGRSSSPRPSTTYASRSRPRRPSSSTSFPTRNTRGGSCGPCIRVGVQHVRYYEETLYGKLEETLPRHELDVTFEQRERWGSLQASLEGSQYLHDLSKYRLEADGEVSLRVVRGLSVSAEVNASRIRDQLSLPRRGATRGRDSPEAPAAPERLPVPTSRSA